MKLVLLTGLDILYPTKQHVQELVAQFGVGGYQYCVFGNLLRYPVAKLFVFRRGYG